MGADQIGVIRAGIIGLAVARHLGMVRPGMELIAIDKERRVGANQTSHNSGVLHAGTYYTPASL